MFSFDDVTMSLRKYDHIFCGFNYDFTRRIFSRNVFIIIVFLSFVDIAMA